ncbi:MAG: HEAT repeat domain-containing protein [Planctomycetes bacterium]|nr:HEAT repeat domain-containing protein [Planctomycetota bacterium]
MVRTLWLTLLFAAIAVSARSASPAPRDLDVLVPSGSPLDWAVLTPQRYVRPEGAFELTRTDASGRYAAPPSKAGLPLVGFARPIELLTLDFASHLSWQQPGFTTRRAAVTGNKSALGHTWPLDPDPDLYWRTTGLLLQAMLHPGRIVNDEVGAELLLLGDGAAQGLDAATSLDELAPFARRVRNAIGRTPFRPPPPSAEGLSPSDALLQRFVAEELLAARPHSNDFLFGRRLALLREESLPWTAKLADSPHDVLRRAAVAFLAMIDTARATEALTQVAADRERDDLVARARAIRALGRRKARGSAATLRAALELSRESIEQALLRRALGDLGDAAAIPALIERRDLFADDGEPLLSRLLALARIDAGDQTQKVREFVAPLLEESPTLRDAAKLKLSGHRPDVPDPEDLRVKAIVQLARFIAWQLSPDDATLMRQATAPFLEVPLAGGRLKRHACRTFGSLSPVARGAFAERLGGCGETGAALAARIARDESCEIELRLAAVEGLANPGRLDLAAALGKDEATALPLRLALLELLDRASDLRALDVAWALLRGAAASEGAVPDDAALRQTEPDSADANWRLLLAAQALGRRHALTSAQLIAALRSTAPAALPTRVGIEVWIEAFVDDVVARKRRGMQLRVAATDLVARIFQLRDRASDAAAREGLAAWIAGQAEAVLEQPERRDVRDAAERAIRQRLDEATRGGEPSVPSEDPLQQVPLRETLLMELARIGDAEAVEALADLARDFAWPERAAACVALGATRHRDAAPQLAFLLRDGDPFVRLCAWISLRRLTSQDFFANWIDGDPRERDAACLEWARWLANHR